MNQQNTHYTTTCPNIQQTPRDTAPPQMHHPQHETQNPMWVTPPHQLHPTINQHQLQCTVQYDSGHAHNPYNQHAQGLPYQHIDLMEHHDKSDDLDPLDIAQVHQTISAHDRCLVQLILSMVSVTIQTMHQGQHPYHPQASHWTMPSQSIPYKQLA